MSLNRRDFLVTSLALMAAGCESASTHAILDRPGPLYPNQHPQHQPRNRVEVVRGGQQQVPTAYRQPAAAQEPVVRARTMEGLHAIPRSQWAAGQPNPKKMYKMGRVERLTIHHEGSPKPVTFTDLRSTRARLEAIRRYHTGKRGWGDIGYHYMIDRSGRVWEGRPVMYQGAHVRKHNENNIGIMVLGNFEKQAPSDAQLAAVQTTVASLRRQYRVDMKNVRSHREWVATTCPGRYLQPRFAAMRSNGAFA